MTTYPLAMPEDLLTTVRRAAKRTHLSQQDVIRQSIKFGLPRLVASLQQQSGRVTNVDPLPAEVLDRIYAKPEEDDEEGVRRFMAAQSFGGDD